MVSEVFLKAVNFADLALVAVQAATINLINLCKSLQMPKYRLLGLYSESLPFGRQSRILAQGHTAPHDLTWDRHFCGPECKSHLRVEKQGPRGREYACATCFCPSGDCALECKPFWLALMLIGCHGKCCRTQHAPPPPSPFMSMHKQGLV